MEFCYLSLSFSFLMANCCQKINQFDIALLVISRETKVLMTAILKMFPTEFFKYLYFKTNKTHEKITQ